MHKESCLCNAKMYAPLKDVLKISKYSEMNLIMEWRNGFWMIKFNLELEIDQRNSKSFEIIRV